ncbi:MAG: methyltransferase [Clostridiales bacterium]|jgi:tRNA1Val (adenine37-N6)-methyltransferase|nr:methyltransferase [Clostridiales bacterium]
MYNEMQKNNNHLWTDSARLSITKDDLQINGLQIFQIQEHFKFGSDAVQLANFVKPRKNAVALDIGSGTGIVPILLAGKLGIKKVFGIEIDEQIAQLSRLSVALNNQQEFIEIIHAPIQKIECYLKSGSCNIVTSNPPFFAVGSGECSGAKHIANSRFEHTLTLLDTVLAAKYLLNTGGKFYIIHKIDRLAEVMTQCASHRLQPKLLKILDKKRFVLQCTKDGKIGLKMG